MTHNRGVTERIIDPIVRQWTAPTDYGEEPESAPSGRSDLMAMRWAAAVAALFLLTIAITAFSNDSPLKGARGDFAPLLNGIVVLSTLFFALTGLAYGICAGTFSSSRSVVQAAVGSIASMSPFVVMTCAAAIFLSLLDRSNLARVFAQSGAQWIHSIGVGGILLMFALMFLSATVNLVLGSAAAKWTLLAPMFVPMLMTFGFSPEATQGVFRIGGMVTHGIAPTNAYLPLVLSIARKYMPGFGLGSYYGLMLPFAAAYISVGFIVGLIWIKLGLPVGPGSPIYLR